MKTWLKQLRADRTLFSGVLPAIAVFLPAALPLAAALSPTYTGTGYLVDVPVPGILCTNNSGQVSLHGNVHVLRVQANDPRLTVRFQAMMDLAYQTDGSALFSGAACQEVGTWNVGDPLNPKFTPTGGMWQCQYTGIAQPDGGNVVHLTGYGIGGTIDGLLLEETMTKGPGVPFAPAVTYTGTAIIKDPPINTSIVLDDFADGRVKSQWIAWSTGTAQLVETNGQFTVRGAWNKPANQYIDFAAGFWQESWTVDDGHTIEWRADVVAMNADASAIVVGLETSKGNSYKFTLASDRVSLDRWTEAGGVVPLFSDSAAVRRTNAVLSFALTRRQTEAVVTIQVLDKGAQNAVLYAKSILDTAPFLDGSYFGVGVEAKPELAKPVVTATFDNVERRTYEMLPVRIGQTIQLTWPARAGVNYTVEGAPTIQGPWLPVNDLATPGLQQITVPANDTMKFFRLR